MVSSQKILILIISLNVLIGIVTTMDEQMSSIQNMTASYPEDNPLTLSMRDSEQKHDELKDDDTVWNTLTKIGDYLAETTIGNTILWGVNIGKTFIEGVTPINMINLARETEEETERGLYTAIAWFQTILSLLAGFEIYLIIKNKKAT